MSRFQRACARIATIALLAGGLTLAEPAPPAAQAALASPVEGGVYSGNVLLHEASGECCGTKIHVWWWNGSGWQELLVPSNGGGGLAYTWVTWGYPNGAYHVWSEGRYCKRRIFGSCVDHAWRTLSAVNITLANQAIVTLYGPDAAVWDDQVSVSAHLHDQAYGYALANRAITFSLGESSVVATTNGNGDAVATFRAGGSGTSTLAATFAGDAYERAHQASKSVAITPVPAVVELEGPVRADFGEPVTISARLVKAPPRAATPLPGRGVTFQFDGRTVGAVTDGNGRAQATYLLDMPSGTYPLSVSRGSDGQVDAASIATSFGTDKRRVLVQPRMPGPAHPGNEVVLGATLRDADPPNLPLVGKALRFEVDTASVTRTSNQDGEVEASVPLDLDPGSYPLRYRFLEEENYLGVELVSTLAVQPVPTQVELTTGASEIRYGEELAVTAALRDRYEDRVLAGLPIRFDLGGRSVTATTDADGIARATLPVEVYPSTSSVTATFDGTTRLATASDATPLTILQRPLELRAARHLEAVLAPTGTPIAGLGVHALDALTGEPAAGVPVTLGFIPDGLDTTTLAHAVTMTTAGDGLAGSDASLPLPAGLYETQLSSPGSPIYEAATAESLFAVGWQAFTAPDGSGAVFIDPEGDRVRAIAPTTDPATDTGTLQRAVDPVSGGDRTLRVERGSGGGVSGTFDLVDGTFDAVIDGGPVPIAIRRDTNTAPSADAGPARTGIREHAPLTLTGQAADDGDLVAFWDLGDGTTRAGASVTHAFDDRTTDARVTYDAELITIDDAGAVTRSATSIEVLDADAPAAPRITTAARWQPGTALVLDGDAAACTRIEILDGGSLIGATDAACPGTDASPWSASLELDGEGPHALVARAIRIDGDDRYASDASLPVEIGVDLGDPVAQLVFPADAAILSRATLEAGCGTAALDLCGGADDATSGIASIEARLTRLADGRSFDGTGFTGSGTWLPVDGAAWTLTLPAVTTIDDGGYRIESRATDRSGRTSTAMRAFTLDTRAPAAPTISTPAEGAILDTAQITVTGQAEPAAQIRLLEGGIELAAGVADVDGGYALPVTLSRGIRSLVTVAEDAAGNRSVESAVRRIEIDTDAPSAPTVRAPRFTNQTLVPIEGRTEAAARIRLLDGETPLTETVADPTGAFTVAVPLGEGEHQVRALAIDAAGNTGAASTPVAVTVDRTAPAAPRLLDPAGPVGDPVVTLRGDAEPLATIEIRDAGSVLAAVAADGTGSWSATITRDEGAHALELEQLDRAGNRSARANVTIVVDLTPPAPPVTTLPEPGSHLDDDALTLTGTAEPFAQVRAYLEQVPANASRRVAAATAPAASTTADAEGSWTLTVPLQEGTVRLRVEVADPAGNAVALPPVTLEIDRSAPEAPQITSPRSGATIRGATFWVQGTGTPGTTVELQLDGVTGAARTVAADGRWQGPVTAPFGARTVTAVAVDLAGNRSPASSPVALRIEPPLDHAVPRIDAPLERSVHDVRVVELLGRAAADARIGVLVDGQPAAIVTADPHGTWSLRLPFAAGVHEVRVNANDGPYGASRTFTVTAVDPAITSPAPDAILPRAIRIEARAGAQRSVALLVDGIERQSRTSAADGTVTFYETLAPGARTLQVRSAGLLGAPVEVRVDGAAPAITASWPAEPLTIGAITVTGTATDDLVVDTVELEVLDARTGQQIRRVTATCDACGIDDGVAWSVTLTLPPGAYRFRAIAVDRLGTRSPAATRTWVAL